MGIAIEWDNAEHSIVRYTFNGKWTWDDLYRSIDAGEQMSHGSSVRVHAILDVRKGAMLPGGSFMNPQARGHAQNLAKRAKPDRGNIVVVGANPFIRSMIGMFTSLFADQAGGVAFADSLDEARVLLQQMGRRALPNMA